MRLHELGAVVFRYGLWIALPMIGMLLFVNIVLGFISRIAPQMNAFAIGFPLTLSAGLVGIAMTLPMLDGPVVALLKLATEMFRGVKAPPAAVASSPRGGAGRRAEPDRRHTGRFALHIALALRGQLCRSRKFAQV